ncbi:MAG: type VI secretion system baseplate subunit TssK [Acidobacteria bacterium]|nr:type VI secretion system baseplate subunit TssK [Acidobacteriota bacterium]
MTRAGIEIPGLRPVLWLKGTFLTPQHLQSSDRYFERRLCFQRTALYSFPWGWLRLAIDEEHLASGAVRLVDACGLLPDGLAIDAPTSAPLPPARAVEGYFPPGEDSLDVFVAVPEERPYEKNLTLDPGGRARFLATAAAVPDEQTPAIVRPLQLASPNLRILFGSEPREGFTCLPALRLRRGEAGQLLLDPSFVPPLLRISASGALTSSSRRLVEDLQVRASSLYGVRRQKNLNLAEFTAGDIAQFWLLHTLNSAFPTLRHLVHSADAHPEELFAEMTELAGTLLTFSTHRTQMDLPCYEHDDLGGCFLRLDALLQELLATVVPANFLSVALRPMGPSLYGATLDDDRLFQHSQLYLGIEADTAAQELIEKVPQLVKVCSAQHIEHLVRQALPGAPLTHEPRPPVAIPVKLRHQYFRISQAGLAWEAVTRARTMSVYIPGDLPRPKVELIAVFEDAGQ